MRSSFVSYVGNRFLLADLAYEMLDRGWIETAPETEIYSVVSTLLAEPSDRSYETVDSVDKFLQRACSTELLSFKGSALQWRSVKTQAYLAALVLFAKYGEQDSRDEQEAATWLQEKAILPQWHEPITMMSYYIESKEQAHRIADLLATTAPSSATWYHERLEAGFFDVPPVEQRFLGEIASPLGDVSFWKEALKDCDPDTRRQAALVLGTARITEAERLLLGMLEDNDDQVRARVVWALGRLVTGDEVEYLPPLLEDPSRRVRFQSSQALAMIRGKEGKIKSTTQFPSERVERVDKKVLVSDDHQDLRNMYKVIWERAGYKALYASGGEETLELARCEHPDLITTDIMNSHMMGTDLVLKLRRERETREIPIALVSAQPVLWFSIPLPWLGLFWGADAYLQKPFDVRELVKLADQMLID
jgi:CheY-like chemotaxis protein